MTALERGIEMMHIPQGKLPPLALSYARYLCSKLGGCMEVFITAYAGYAEVIEGLPATDPAYNDNGTAAAYFRSQNSEGIHNERSELL